VTRLGFWTAILSAVFSAGWAVSMFGVQQVLAPMPAWRGASAYAQDFRPLQLLNLYPSLFLALAFLGLLACIYAYAPPDKKIWSLIALCVGVLYATMASVNYNVQFVAVRQSLLAGETDGIAMLPQANPHSIFWALANAYAYMSLAMLLLVPVFTGGRLERWIRWLLVAAGLSGPAQLAVTLFDVNGIVMLLFGPLWIVATPMVCAQLAVLFRRAGRATAAPEQA
jgi:hypothetical protein